MGKINLISGDQQFSEILKNRIRRAGGLPVILSEETEIDSNEETEDGDSEILWNKRSSLSARNAVLSCINKHERIDDAFICYQPEELNKAFHEMSAPVYDLQIDRWIRGYGYLLKELLHVFIKQKSGRLSLILSSDDSRLMTPLESAVYSYLRTLIKNLSSFYQDEPVSILCFETDSRNTGEFFDYIFKIIDDGKYSPGKVYKYSERKSLFDFKR